MTEFRSASPADTERVAASLAHSLERGDVVTVAGELGSGKTTFVRGACRALGVESPVTSPTYTIGNRYAGPVPVAHLDLYRLSELSEEDWADLEPYFEGAIAFVEWPEAGERYLPAPRACVRLRLLDRGHRVIEVREAENSLQIAASRPC